MTLKRGIIKSKDLWDWVDLVRDKGWQGQRDVSITLLDEGHENTVSRWVLQNAVPTKYTGPSLNAKGGTDVAMEELVISAEGILYSE